MDNSFYENEKIRIDEINTFASSNNIQLNKKKLKTLVNLCEEAWKSYQLDIIIGKSCKSMDISKAMIDYQQKQLDYDGKVKPSIQCYYQLLSLVCGFGEQG